MPISEPWDMYNVLLFYRNLHTLVQQGMQISSDSLGGQLQKKWPQHQVKFVTSVIDLTEHALIKHAGIL